MSRNYKDELEIEEKRNEKLREDISKLESELLISRQSWKSRLKSRKFLLSAGSAVVTLIVALALMFGVKVDSGQLMTVMTAFVSLIALFVLPESITDHKERMKN